jgi:hypothetical protein
MKLSAIQPRQEPRELVLDFGEAGTVNMTVLPDKFTLGHQRAIKRAQKESDLPAMADVLFSAIEEWDLEDDDGEVIPLDESGIDKFTFVTALGIANKMTEALGAPKPETSSESPHGSPTRTSRKRSTKQDAATHSLTT